MSSGSAGRDFLDRRPGASSVRGATTVQTGVSGSLRISAFWTLRSRTNSEWPMVSAVTSSSTCSGMSAGSTSISSSRSDVVEHAAEVAHAVGDADQADRHLRG